jgi:PEP-CTERM motif-containing protein
MVKRSFLSGLVAVGLIALPVFAGGNLLTNGDFSAGDDGWSTAGTGGSTNLGGGNAVITGPDGGAGGGFVEIWQEVNAAGGDVTVSFDVVTYSTIDIGYTPAFDSAYVSINANSFGINEDGSTNPGLVPGSGGQDGYGNLSEGDGFGSNISVELTAPGTNPLRIALGVDTVDNLFGPAVLTVDNVVVTPEPTTAAMLALGAAALLRRRRR